MLVVASNTTPGLRRDYEELTVALQALGLTVSVATSTYGLLGHIRPLAYALNELVTAASLRHAARRALRGRQPRAVIVTTSTSGALLPACLLGRAGIRFDGLAGATRLRRLDAPSRALERRCLARARVALPYSAAAAGRLERIRPPDRPCLVWPSPVRPGPAPLQQRLPAALCYANDPEKKGLDLAVAAWGRAAPDSHRLLVTGIEPARGRSFVRQRGVSAGTNIQWLGRLSEAEYRRLSASVAIYLGASRVDQFATTQLEALMDGALLVTAPSRGPMEALELARRLDPRLVATAVSVEALVRALEAALAMSVAARADYRARAQTVLRPYSREAFFARLSAEVLPLLLDSG